MASTKATTALWSGQTLTAGAGDTTTAVLDLTNGYGGTLNIKLTNGGAGPTLPAQVQIQCSEDNFTEDYDVGDALEGLTGNAAVISWGMIVVPPGTQYLRLVAGSNTDQDVVVDADFSEVTEV